jgi:hypothetical protein
LFPQGDDDGQTDEPLAGDCGGSCRLSDRLDIGLGPRGVPSERQWRSFWRRQGRRGAFVPGAAVTLVNQQTGAVQSTRTNEAGLFVFPSLLPGTYRVEVSAPGSRLYQVKDIGLTTNERRSLGEIVLEVGQVQERVEVIAEVTPVQTASAERSGLITTSQLMNMAIRGRDFVSLLATLPGIYDENMQSRDVS